MRRSAQRPSFDWTTRQLVGAELTRGFGTMRSSQISAELADVAVDTRLSLYGDVSALLH
jgi:hypothetical protein